jgi:Domain of unknown function (DUF5916)/Carbohydrate family 9 binding domain-like
MVPLTSMVLAAVPTVAQPVLRAERVDRPPVVDGRIDDAAWKKAPPSSEFTQKLPDDGKAPGEPTTVRVVYDDTAIYVAVECVQKSAKIVAPLTRRDRDVESDGVAINLATRGDGQTAFEFAVNPAGVLQDATRFDDTSYSRDWDENWVGKAAVTADGWSAEFQIPLRILRFEEKPVQSFGLQVRRYTSARKETVEWAHIARSEAGEVSRYGRLENLVGLKKGSSFQLRPFVVGKIGSRDTDTAPLARGFSPAFSAGADFKWLVLPSLTLDGAILPDFGQVDADKVVLNLSSYETYFPEKRPFFLEAADVFSTPMQLLYTRRIGHAEFAPSVFDPGCYDPDNLPDHQRRRCLSRSEKFLTTPDPSPIYGALKLTGTLDEKWNVGALLAVSGSSSAETVDGRATHRNRTADPLSVYKVFRARRNFEGGSSLGLLATGVSRLESPGDYPAVLDRTGQLVLDRHGKPRQLCPGGEELAMGERCFHNAYSASIDGKHRFMDGDYTVLGQLMGTLISGGPERQMADGTVIRSGDASPGGRIEIKKTGGGHIRSGLTYQIHGKTLDYNDLGYMQRQNIASGDFFVEYDTNGPWSRFNDGFLGVYIYDNETLDFINTSRGAGLFAWAQFKNFWRTFVELNARADYHDDREIGDGSTLQRPGSAGLYVETTTDERKAVNLRLATEPRLYTNGAASVYVDATLKVRALPQLELELSPTFTFTAGEPRFYDYIDDSYVFGKLEAASLSATLSGTYTFLPNLTLQVYAQAFTAYGRYSHFSGFPIQGATLPHIRLAELAAARDPRIGPDGRVNHDYDYDFVSGTFNANVVMRWEYRLGSTLYLVYTHGQSNDMTQSDITTRGLRPGVFDFRLASPRPAADIFLLKASYWWG